MCFAVRVSVLCWTGPSFCPEFKTREENTEESKHLHLPIAPSRSCILVLPAGQKHKLHWAIAAAGTRAHPSPAESRLAQALPRLPCISSITDPSAKQCLRHPELSGALCRPAVLCLGCSSHQGQTLFGTSRRDGKDKEQQTLKLSWWFWKAV